MESVITVFISIPREEAKAMAKGLVENRLAACVNILPRIESYYWWDDKVDFDEEALLIAKTAEEKFDALEDYVRENHPLELPEILAIPLTTGFKDYIGWVRDETMK
jgi:periplasmic divalent cation tolerance protein